MSHTESDTAGLNVINEVTGDETEVEETGIVHRTSPRLTSPGRRRAHPLAMYIRVSFPGGAPLMPGGFTEAGVYNHSGWGTTNQGEHGYRNRVLY